MLIKIKKKDIINVITYVIFLLTYLISLEKFGMGETNSRIRYYMLVLSIGIGVTTLFIRYKKSFLQEKKKLYGKELLLIFFTSIVFLLVSISKAKQAEIDLNIRTYVQISLILLPALYAFCIVNIFSIKTIIHIMEFTLFVVIGAYFCEEGHTILDFFVIKNWTNISLIKSTSFTESHICSETFLQLFIFFYYFKNINNEKIDSKILNLSTVLSFIFTILSFKRLGMLFAISLVILEKLIDFRGKISSKFAIIFALFFTVITVFYTKFMQGYLFTDVDVFSLTSGRDYILSLWAKKDYLSYGYGSSMLLIGRYLEMDLVQIYLELNKISLYIFCYTIFKNAKQNIYSYIVMCYVFMNMLTASSLPYSLGWVLLLTTITCISSNKCNDEEINITIKKRKIKRLFYKEEINNGENNSNNFELNKISVLK